MTPPGSSDDSNPFDDCGPDFADDITKGCYLQNQDYLSDLEAKRMAEVEKEIPGLAAKDYSFKKYDQVIPGITLKLIV